MKSVFAARDFARRSVNIVMYEYRGSQEFAAAPMYMRFQEVSPELGVDAPSLTITIERAQDLLQELWDLGLRPDDGEGSSGQVAALKRHVTFAETVALRLLEKHT